MKCSTVLHCSSCSLQCSSTAIIKNCWKCPVAWSHQMCCETMEDKNKAISLIPRIPKLLVEDSLCKIQLYMKAYIASFPVSISPAFLAGEWTLGTRLGLIVCIHTMYARSYHAMYMHKMGGGGGGGGRQCLQVSVKCAQQRNEGLMSQNFATQY